MRSDKNVVLDFLEQLKNIIEQPDFEIEKNFTFIINDKEDIKYSTTYTLLDLEYDSEDVIYVLKNLTIGDYSETVVDKDDNNPPLLYVFGQDINKKTVYIKLKIRGTIDNHIVCVSFHYAKYPMTHPYK